MHQFFREGVRWAHSAVTEDTQGNHDKALKYYIRALEYMITSMKYERNKRNLEIIKKQCQNVFQRAEEIKVLLGGAETAATPAAAAAAAAAQDAKKSTPQQSKQTGKKSDPDNDLTDMSPLRAQLEDLIIKEKPSVTWDDVVGMEDAKQAMEEAIVLPTRYPQLFVGKRRPPSGILLFGPPGTGKTYLAKACASMSDSTFFAVSSAALVSKYQGESEKLVRELFRMARESRPSIVFIDEIDALGTKRSDEDTDSIRRIKNELLIQLQKADDEGGIMVLGATNTPFALDPAMRRRFHRRIYIPLPDALAREAIIKTHIGKNIDTKIEQSDIKRFAERTEGHSASDIAVMVRDALMSPVRRAMKATHFKKDKNGYIVSCDPSDPDAKKMDLLDIENPELLKVDPVQLEDFEASLVNVKPSVSKKDVEEHIRFAEMYGEGPGLSRQNVSRLSSKSVAPKPVTSSKKSDIIHRPKQDESLRRDRSEGANAPVPL